MKRVIALVGRPNVGKSTLFNRLTRSRDALVADEPGLTRDRRYGRAQINGEAFIVVDTGGLTGEEQGLDALVARQSALAVEEADAVLFVVDGRAGLNSLDEQIAARLRTAGKPIMLVANKAEGLDKDAIRIEMYRIGLGEVYPVSAEHGEGVVAALEALFARLPERDPSLIPTNDDGGAKVAVVGRPNAGKSTLINRILGEERVLAYDLPGTTRDSIFIPFDHNGNHYTLIDTAGVRRRSRVSDKLEKFSVVKTLQAIDECHVVILVLDAQEGINAHDAALLGYVVEAGKALIIAVNKWDGLTPDQRERVRSDMDLKLSFVDYAAIHFISALHGSGVGLLLDVAQSAFQNAFKQFPTPLLTDVLERCVAAHQPPLVSGRRVKLRYAHQGGQNPPVIVIHGKQTEKLPDSYRRYLSNAFRDALKLEATPIRIELRTGENPFAGKRNELTPGQIERRRRMMKHVKSRR